MRTVKQRMPFLLWNWNTTHFYKILFNWRRRFRIWRASCLLQWSRAAKRTSTREFERYASLMCNTLHRCSHYWRLQFSTYHHHQQSISRSNSYCAKQLNSVSWCIQQTELGDHLYPLARYASDEHSMDGWSGAHHTVWNSSLKLIQVHIPC